MSCCSICLIEDTAYRIRDGYIIQGLYWSLETYKVLKMIILKMKYWKVLPIYGYGENSLKGREIIVAWQSLIILLPWLRIGNDFSYFLLLNSPWFISAWMVNRCMRRWIVGRRSCSVTMVIPFLSRRFWWMCLCSITRWCVWSASGPVVTTPSLTWSTPVTSRSPASQW